MSHYLYDIEKKGIIAGRYPFRALGYNGNVNGTREDMWTVGGDYVFPTVAQQVKIVSDSASDTAAGTGARTVDIHYLNFALEEKEYTFTMNGITAVNGPTDVYRVNYFEVMTVGTGNVAAGNIIITNMAGNETYGKIEANSNVALQAVFTIPTQTAEGKPIGSGYITGWDVGVAGSTAGKAIIAWLRVTANKHADLTTGVFHFKDITMVSDGSSPMEMVVPIRCPAGADIKISIIGQTTNNVCAGHFEGWLE